MDRLPEQINKEKELLDLYLKHPSQEVLGKIFGPYQHLLYGLCLKYFKNAQDAEDAVVDIYLSITEKLKKHEVKNFKSWLYVVGRNHCLDVLRSRNSKLPKENQAKLVYSMEVYHPNIDDKEDSLKVMEKCMEELNPTQKHCLEMFYFQKLSYETITTKSKLTWGQVRSYIQNGRRNLKNCMEKNGSR